MFLRCKVRRKDGKHHRYWSVVENTRVAGGRVVQRHVLYLGEINDSQELAWRRSMEVLEAGAAAVARAAARSVLVEAAGSEPQRDALGSGAVRARRLPLAGAGQRMAAAPRVVSAQRAGRSAGRGCRAGRDPQAVPLSRPAADTQASGL